MLQAQQWAKFAILQGVGLNISINEIKPIAAGYKESGGISWLYFKIKNQPNFDYRFDGYVLQIVNNELKTTYQIVVNK